MAFANYSAKAIMVFTLGFLRELFLILCYWAFFRGMPKDAVPYGE